MSLCIKFSMVLVLINVLFSRTGILTLVSTYLDYVMYFSLLISLFIYFSVTLYFSFLKVISHSLSFICALSFLIFSSSSSRLEITLFSSLTFFNSSYLPNSLFILSFLFAAILSLLINNLLKSSLVYLLFFSYSSRFLNSLPYLTSLGLTILIDASIYLLRF